MTRKRGLVVTKKPVEIDGSAQMFRIMKPGTILTTRATRRPFELYLLTGLALAQSVNLLMLAWAWL